jgi:hypothetical protein
MTISDDIGSSNILLITTTKEKYNQSVSQIISEIDKAANKIGYITVNRPYNSVIDSIQKKSLNKDKFFFIDTITATVQSLPTTDKCTFVSSPTALTDIGLGFSSLFAEKKCDLIFFDTVSTLIVYQDIGSVTKFVHNLITKARVLNKKAVFLALKEDSESLIKDLNMFVDKVVEI